MASRMAARTSARSVATRDYAASPPKQFSARQSQSPIGRRTRSTRSQSIDLGDSDAVRSPRSQGRRSARQASVESVDSNASGVSSKAGWSRKTRAAKASPDLSMVVEDRETGQDEEEEDEEEDDADEFEGPTHRSQSPGGLSQMSGTTAMTSRSAASAMTSHSVNEIESLDPMMVECLPELLRSSWRILDHLAPPDASSGTIETIVKELRIIGSRTAKKLKIDEESFKHNRCQFGSDDYINPSFIQRRLFGNQGIDLGVSRPDAILYAANIATLVKSLLVNQKESRGTPNWLQLLDTYFPEAFLGQFENDLQFGNSLLLDESFKMGLEIRTQYTLVLLLVYKEKGGEEWDPDRILLSLFVDPPGNLQAPPSPYFEDALKHGRVKDIMRNGPENSEEQNTRVKHRIAEIRSTFRRGNDALEVGDLVDFEALEDMFPWVAFLTQLVQWSRWRLDEIKTSIEQQGGPENIKMSLIELINNHNSQIEVKYEPPPAIMEPRYPLIPPTIIKPGTSGHSLYNKDAVIALERIKRGISSSDAPPSNQLQQKALPKSLTSLSANQAGPSRTRPIGNNQRDSENFQAIMDDDGGEIVRGTQEYLSSWESHNRDKNKENRPVSDREKASTGKRSLLDRQADARKIEWDFDNSSDPSNAKRPRQEESEASEGAEDEDEDEDQDFQLDRRIPNPSRRAAAPTARRPSPIPVTPPPLKRARVQSVEDEVARARLSNRQRAEAALQASARGAAPYDEDEDGDGDDALNTPPPSYANINAASRLAVAQAKQVSRETQKRVPWSERDTQHLIDLIEDYGCSWAEISKASRFEHERGQVALKDKARNLKVTFLKAGNPLPQNFDKVALGRKEIEAVRTVFPDFDGRT